LRNTAAGARPAGETADDRNAVIAALIFYRPNQVNDLKDATDAFDVDGFNQVVAQAKPGKLKPLVRNLSAANETAWLSWAMANRPMSNPAFRKLYPGADAIQQETYMTKAFIHSDRAVFNLLID
jgi:hypothetical protein